MLLENCINVQQKLKAFLTETEFSKYEKDQNQIITLIFIGLKNSPKIKNRFLRQELFALKDQLVKQRNQSSFILKTRYSEWIISLRWIFQTLN